MKTNKTKLELLDEEELNETKLTLLLLEMGEEERTHVPNLPQHMLGMLRPSRVGLCMVPAMRCPQWSRWMDCSKYLPQLV